VFFKVWPSKGTEKTIDAAPKITPAKIYMLMTLCISAKTDPNIPKLDD